MKKSIIIFTRMLWNFLSLLWNFSSLLWNFSNLLWKFSRLLWNFSSLLWNFSKKPTCCEMRVNQLKYKCVRHLALTEKFQFFTIFIESLNRSRRKILRIRYKKWANFNGSRGHRSLSILEGFSFINWYNILIYHSCIRHASFSFKV